MKTYILVFYMFSALAAVSQSYTPGVVFGFIKDEAFTTSTIKCSTNSVTVAQDAVLKNIFTKYGVTGITKKVPAAKSPSKFSKFYTIQCSVGNEVALANELNLKVSKYFSRIQRIPQNNVLYEPNDYKAIKNTSDWALDLIRMREAWDYTKGDVDIRIAIVDNGFDTDHEELKNKIVFQNGYVGTQDTSSNGTITTQSHGTAVACRAAAETDNSVGQCGTGFNCKLMLYKGLDEAHILDAAIRGADVINCSFGSTGSSDISQEMIDSAFRLGAIIVAGAGNGRCWECNCDDLTTCNTYSCDGGRMGFGRCRIYPASYNHVISVSSVGSTDLHEKIPGDTTSTHQHNDSIDICAPGYDVMTARPGNTYWVSNGTSFASPIVAGICGLILSVNPCLSNVQVEQIIKQTAVNIYNKPENQRYIGLLGAGRIDAYAAVQAAVSMSVLNITNKIITVNSNDTSQYRINVENVKIQGTPTVRWNARGDILLNTLEIAKGATLELNTNPEMNVPCE